ncbi:hypothetical protein ACFL0C_02110 [Patescibacteria group bacterium]
MPRSYNLYHKLIACDQCDPEGNNWYKAGRPENGGFKNCPNCGHPLSASDLQKMGDKVTDPIEFKRALEGRHRDCPHCTSRMPLDYDHCANCGGAMEGEAVEGDLPPELVAFVKKKAGLPSETQTEWNQPLRRATLRDPVPNRVSSMPSRTIRRRVIDWRLVGLGLLVSLVVVGLIWLLFTALRTHTEIAAVQQKQELISVSYTWIENVSGLTCWEDECPFVMTPVSEDSELYYPGGEVLVDTEVIQVTRVVEHVDYVQEDTTEFECGEPIDMGDHYAQPLCTPDPVRVVTTEIVEEEDVIEYYGTPTPYSRDRITYSQDQTRHGNADSGWGAPGELTVPDIPSNGTPSPPVSTYRVIFSFSDGSTKTKEYDYETWSTFVQGAEIELEINGFGVIVSP